MSSSSPGDASGEAPGLSFAARFAARVAEAPGAPALDEDGHILSYGELDQRVGELAERLAAFGLEDGQFGAITLGRGRGDIIARLALLRLGCGFLPLPPELPAERRAIAMELGRPAVLLRSGDEPERPKVERLCSTSEAARLERAGWAILSSGTTGRPKLIQLRRDGLPGLLDAQIPAFQLAPGDRSLSVLSLAFDATISDQLTTLAAGACLVFDKSFAGLSLAERLPRLGALGISQIDLPPALLARLPGPAPGSLKTLIIGGEVCPPAVIAARSRELRVVVCYGPTEATVCTSMVIHERPDAPGRDHDKRDQTESSGEPSRDWIGRPIAGLRYRLAPDPEASRGELVIEGHAACSFYPGAEAERAGRGPEGVFHTRDLVERVPASGDPRGDRWAFLGRLDRQVKLRGLLVAPEELERELERRPGVLRAAALKASGPTREALVAFITGPPCPPARPGDGMGERLGELRGERKDELIRGLAERLPGWMIPARIRVLAALPETPTGKPDFAALAALERAGGPGTAQDDEAAAESSGGRPADGEEARTRALIELFREVLGAVEVGPETDFFDAGGDSLAALDLTALAERRGLGFAPSDLERLRRPDRLARSLLEPEATDLRSRDELDQSARAAGEAVGLFGPAPILVGDAPRRDLLLTGATGRLGRRVLAELLNPSRAVSEPRPLTVLLRGPLELARTRLFRRLEELDPSLPAHARGRLTVLSGDLAEPGLGLDPSARRRLAQSCGTILHLAAAVDLLAGFASLRRVNLDAVAELLRLGQESPGMRLLQASTLSCFVAGPRFSGLAREDDELDAIPAVSGGYAQTKFAAERLIGLAAGSAGAFGGPISIVRYGLLLDPEVARPDPRDLFDSFVAGLLELGAVPERGLEALRFDLTPLDRAARATTALLDELEARPRSAAQVRRFHVAASRGVSAAELVAALAEQGHQLERLAPGDWRRRVREAVARGRMRGLAALALARLELPGAFERQRSVDLFQATDMRFDSRAADAILASLGLAAGPPRRDHLEALIRRFPASIESVKETT